MTPEERKMYEQLKGTMDALKGTLGDTKKVFELAESYLPKNSTPITVDDHNAELSLGLNGKSVMITFDDAEVAMQFFENFRNVRIRKS